MDAILTACIAFATWQLVEFIQNKKVLNVAGAALGLALGFSTKGMIAVFVPAIGILFYVLYKKDWKIFLNPKWFLLFILFTAFISPVLYCYYLQFNLHPEKMIRGKDHINGIKFILFNQSVERFGGKVDAVARHDYFFFLHSFLWAFAPWSILTYIAIACRIKNFLQRKPASSGSGRDEWLTSGVFLVMLVIVSLSGFKLPHYLNILFPTTAVLVAAFILSKKGNVKWVKIIFLIQIIFVSLLLLLSAVINEWAFPAKSSRVIIGVVLLLAVVFYFIKSAAYDRLQKAVAVSVAAMIFSFFLLNSNFYPQLLKYQGGKELAVAVKGKLNPDDVYFWKNTFSSSFNFYTKTLYKPFADSVLQPGKKVWLIYDIKDEAAIKQAGYQLGQRFSVLDYEVTKLDIKFVNPATREKQCSMMVLAELSQ
jgi:4-amino-4-deoxy-L-arabinose transferase-like glycosyltransferase